MEPNEIASVQPFLTYKSGKILPFSLMGGGCGMSETSYRYTVPYHPRTGQTRGDVTSRSLATIVF